MRQFLFILWAAVLSAGQAFAQQPQTSTDADPVWYYIQVLGDGSRTGRVMTVVDGRDVYGRAKIDAPEADGAATQLWRVADGGDGCYFVNKATGLYMDVRYDSDRAIGIATLTSDAANAFRLLPLDGHREGYFNLLSSHVPEGGNANELYLHQANDGGERDFIVMMVGDDYANSENSAFRFVEFEDHSLNYSDDETDYWYAIFNAADGQTEVCVTEAPVDDAGDYPFVLENFSDDNPAQQWKFVQRPGGRVVMVNRASGRFIAPTSLPVDLYNVIQPAESLTLTMGWTLTYLGQGQYTVSAKEDDNIVRYWYAATEGQTPGEYDDSNLLNSGFSWTPVAVDSTPVGIADAQADRLAVYVVGGRIVVDGATDYAVYTAGGIRVDPARPQPAGTYIVRAAEGVAKVLVP